MKNKKGFTLIELLVVITIIGIISFIALPGVQQLQARNQVKKFEAYSDTIESAGKLYTDSYSDDMFGMQGNGCKVIPYSELRGKSLIKDYEVDGITCNNNNTFVQVRRENGKYTFKVSLKCTSGDKVIFETDPITPCDDGGAVTDPNAPVVEITYTNDSESQDGVWSKSKTVTIKASSMNGLIDNINIQYGWSTDPNVKPTTMIPHNFRNDYGVSNVSYSFVENSGKNGDWYLFVEADDVIDDGGHVASDKWSSVMKFDSIPPVCNVKFTGTEGDNGWFKEGDVTVSLERSDEGGSNLRTDDYGLTTSSSLTYNKVASSTQGETTGTDWYGYVRDNAGNKGNCNKNVKLDKTMPTCTLTKSGTWNENGFYVSVVTVSFDSKDDAGGSNLASYGLAPNTTAVYDNVDPRQQAASNGVTWYGFVKDTAGNVNRCNTDSFKVLLEPPKITFSISGSTSTARCVDGNTGDFIKDFTKEISESSLKHEVTCENEVGQKTTSSKTYTASYHCTSSSQVCDTCHGSNCGGCCGTGGSYCAYDCNCRDECSGGYYTFS